MIIFRWLFASSKKRRWFTRRDALFLLFLITLLIISFFTTRNQQSNTASTTSHHAQVVTGQTQGRGGSTTSLDNGDQTPFFNVGASQTTEEGLAALPAPLRDSLSTQNTNAQADDNGWFDWFKLLRSTDPNATFKQTQIQKIWGSMVGIIDLFLVLIILMNGIRVAAGAAGFRYADVLESLPRILLAFLAAHLSALFVGCLIALNNGLCESVIAIAGNPANAIPAHDQLNIIQLIIQLITFVAAVILSFIPIPVLQQLAWFITSVNVVGLLVALAAAVLYIFLIIQLLVRLALINLMIILAPFGFACWALPAGAGQQITKLWLNSTFTTIIVQFLQLTCYIFGFVTLNALGTIPLASFGFAGIGNTSILNIAVLWLTLRIPGWLQNVVTNTMGDASRNMSAALSQALGAVSSALSTIVIAFR